MGFLEVKHDLFYQADEALTEGMSRNERYNRELLQISRILHVYIVQPYRTAICIEYLSKHGEGFDMVESFETEVECYARFNEISKILKEDKQK